MDAPLVLAVDQGTSSTKCLLVDRLGAVVATGQAPVPESHPHPGWVEQSAPEIWASVKAAIANCVSETQAKSIAAVAFSTQRESCVIWERKTGKPISPLLSWQDQRTAQLAQAIGTPGVLANVRRISGLPLDPMFSALKARWLLDEIDPDRVKAKSGEICVGTIDSWLLSQFGGESVIEAGNASRTQLLDIAHAKWDADLLELFKVPAAALPKVVSSTGPFPAIRDLAPLPDGIPVMAVMADSHAALFGHGAIRPGDVKATHGTGSSIMGLIETGTMLDPGLCLTIAWSIDGLAFAAEGNIRATGATLRWVSEILGVSTDELAALARTAESENLCLVPGFTGLGAPWWDAQAVAILSGFTLGTTRASIARAALDSIAHQIADVIDALERGGTKASRLFVDGGPTKNDQLMQFEADMTGKPLQRSATAELSALGAAHLAGLGAGFWDRAQLAEIGRQRDIFEPHIDAADRQKARALWLEAVGRARLQRPLKSELAEPV